MLNRAEVGRLGETLASEYLKKRGLKILDRNWKTPRWGEIDIVALEKDILIIVEVKTRTDDSFGKPFEAVNYFKVRTLVRAADFYRKCHAGLPESQRIDVVSVVLEPREIEHFKNIYSE